MTRARSSNGSREVVDVGFFRIVDVDSKGAGVTVTAWRQCDLFTNVHIIAQRLGGRVIAQRKVIELIREESSLSPYAQAEILRGRFMPS